MLYAQYCIYFSFRPVSEDSESDMRFVFCASCICYMLYLVYFSFRPVSEDSESDMRFVFCASCIYAVPCMFQFPSSE